ncbi:unnamed protein product [Chrysoparadoxa australica]
MDIKLDEGIFILLLRFRGELGIGRRSSGGKGGLSSYTRGLLEALGQEAPISVQAAAASLGSRAALQAALNAGAPKPLAAGIYSANATKIYFALIHLHPVDLRLTYKATPSEAVLEAEEAYLGAIAQMDDCRLCLNALQLEHAFGERGVFIELVLRHYKFAFLKQVGNVVGSLEFLGDPAGLLSNLSTGVKDFFYEPIEGLKPQGKGLLYGLGRGGQSLVSNTVQGTFNSFNKVTGSMGNTLAHLSLDPGYTRERARQRAHQGESMADSMAHGAKEFGKGLFDGVTGVVMGPVKGAEREGALGFGKGLVQGVLGVAIKPVVGVFDLGARTFEGIRNLSKFDALGEEHLEDLALRLRPPRSITKLGEMREYDWDQAAAQQVVRAILRNTGDKPLESASLLSKVEIGTERIMRRSQEKPSKQWLIATEERLLLVLPFYLESRLPPDLAQWGIQYNSSVPKLGGARVMWDVPLAAIAAIGLVAGGTTIRITLSRPLQFGPRREALDPSCPVSNDVQGMSAMVVVQLVQNALAAHDGDGMAWDLLPETPLLEGQLMRLHDGQQHMYALHGPMLFEYTQGKYDPALALTMVVPLRGVVMASGRFHGHSHALRITAERGLKLRVAAASVDAGELFQDKDLAELVLVADGQAASERWIQALLDNAMPADEVYATRNAQQKAGLLSLYIPCVGLGEQQAHQLHLQLVNVLAEKVFMPMG